MSVRIPAIFGAAATALHYAEKERPAEYSWKFGLGAKQGILSEARGEFSGSPWVDLPPVPDASVMVFCGLRAVFDPAVPPYEIRLIAHGAIVAAIANCDMLAEPRPVREKYSRIPPEVNLT